MPVPPACQGIQDEIDGLEAERAQLQEELTGAGPAEKMALLRQIVAINRQLAPLRKQLDECIRSHPEPPPVPPIVAIFVGTTTLTTTDPNAPGPFYNDVTLQLQIVEQTITITAFPPLSTDPFSTPLGSDTVTVTRSAGGSGRYDVGGIRGHIFMPITLQFRHSLPGVVDSELSLDLSTDPPGSPLVPEPFGYVKLEGSGRFVGGYFNDKTGTLIADGRISPPGAWRYNDLSRASRAPNAVGDPCAFTWAVDSAQHVFYRDEDGHIHELRFDVASGWHHRNLSEDAGVTGDARAAGDPAGYTWDVDGTQHVVYRGKDDHIHELWSNGPSGWQHNDLTRVTGAPPAVGDPTGYTWDADQTQHVIYRDGDGHIHELWFQLDGGWRRNDVTQAAGVGANQNAKGDPAGYTWSVDGTQHIIYRGHDDHIHELWFNFDGGWRHNDLLQATGVTGHQEANGDPAAYTWDRDQTQRVIYRGKDLTIHELSFDVVGGWRHSDLTGGLPAARYAVADPTGYTWDADNTRHVLYLATDTHIHELWFSTDGGGGQNDLNAATNAPSAESKPAGYTWSVDGTQHVVYRGYDDHIHELWLPFR